MKIWVYLNGIQQGPYTIEEISQLPLSPSTPVWYEGLPQWMPANEAPETAGLFASESTVRQAEPQPAHKTDYAAAQPAYQAWLNDHRPADAPPAPPTFIGWSIFVLLCCFPIGGIVSIIFSVISGNAYRSRDYQKATRMSEYAEWSIILSIVIGLMFTPLALAFL
ncbi:MAG: CD225/dispanin family protein [Muribaculaceae bacterium]|nr:CD225/dispanin family protein [Muribaculaceae bacterium]